MARPIHGLNAFLGRWRRNASHGGIVAVLLAVLVAALAVFALCACRVVDPQMFPPGR